MRKHKDEREQGAPVCSNCGKTAKVAVEDYVFAESGLDNVVLADNEVIRCRHCGNVDPVIHRMDELMSSLAFAMILKSSMLSGPEIRFLRKYLSLNGERFASLLGTDKTTLSKWETGQQRHSGRADRLIRAIVLSLDDRLHERASEAVRQFSDIANDTELGKYIHEARGFAFARE